MQTEHSNINNNNFIHNITAISPLINLIHSTIIQSLSQFIWTSPIGLLLDLTRQFDDNNDYCDYDDYRTATTTITRLQDGDYDHHDYRTATKTITRLQDGDYDHHDSRVATTTITTPGWRLRRLQGGDLQGSGVTIKMSTT